MGVGLQRLKNQAYTGENRCLPCTAVNLVIAFLVAAATLLGAVAVDASEYALGTSLGVFLLSVAAIYFRGYLVPGTPELTKRYLPPWLLQWFGKAPAAGDTETLENPDGAAGPADGVEVDPERLLTDAGALEPCADVDDLCLDESFADAWRASIAETRESGTDRERLVTVLDADDLDPSFEERGDAFWARANGNRVGTWESRAAFIADVAAAPLLAERVDEWDRLSVRARGRLLNGLRLFLEHCPNCGTDLAFATETVESCCSTREVAALSCEDCGARLFESDAL